MKMPGQSDASRTVLLMLLAIGAFELGASGRFGQLWSLAFSSHGSATSDSAAGALHPGQSASPASQGQDSTGASRPGVLH